MPGVYFVTTQEPITGQKTQVTAVFPSRNQSVAVKADNDRKMAEMSLPQKDKVVRFVDHPYTMITPAEPPPCHCYHPHQYYHPPPYTLPPLYHPSYMPLHGMPMQGMPMQGMPMQMMPSPYVPMMQPSHHLQMAPQVPWSTPALPPISMPNLTHSMSAPPDIQQVDSDDDEEIQYAQSKPKRGKRKLRDILLIDDSVVRSMNGQDNASRRRFAAHNKALRVVLESPLHDGGNNMLSSRK